MNKTHNNSEESDTWLKTNPIGESPFGRTWIGYGHPFSCEAFERDGYRYHTIFYLPSPPESCSGVWKNQYLMNAAPVISIEHRPDFVSCSYSSEAHGHQKAESSSKNVPCCLHSSFQTHESAKIAVCLKSCGSMRENCFEGFCSSKLDVHLEEFAHI